MVKEESRRRVIAAALAWTQGTALEASAYEEMLLEEYACGRMSLDGVLAVLEALAETGLGAGGRNWSR